MWKVTVVIRVTVSGDHNEWRCTLSTAYLHCTGAIRGAFSSTCKFARVSSSLRTLHVQRRKRPASGGAAGRAGKSARLEIIVEDEPEPLPEPQPSSSTDV